MLGHQEPNEADRRDLQVLAAPLHGGHHEGKFSAIVHKRGRMKKKNLFILFFYFFNFCGFVNLFVFFIGLGQKVTPRENRIALEAEHPRHVVRQAAKAAKNPNIEC